MREGIQKSGILLLISILKCIVLQSIREQQGRIQFPDSVLSYCIVRALLFLIKMDL